MTPPDSGPGPTLTARTPEDLVALGTVVLGFTPADSVVLMTFGGPRAFHARVDLPPGGRADDLVDLADVLLGPALIHGVHSVVVLVYSDDERLARRAWRALREGAAERDLVVVEALRVTERRWYPLRPGAARRVAAGTAYDVSAHPFVVQMILEGRVTLGSREELAATLAPDPAAVASVDAAVRARHAEPPAGPAEVLAAGEWARATVQRHLRDDTRPGDDETARLLTDLTSLRVRDAVLGLTRRDDDDPVRARRLVDLWRDVVRRSPEPLAAAPAMLLAWSAWQAGDGALAWCGIDRCRRAHPDYRLAEVLAVLLDGAAAPGDWDVVGDLDWTAGLRAG